MKLILSVITCLILLTGCDFAPKKPTIPPPAAAAAVVDTTIKIDPRSLLPCSDMVLPDLPVSFESILASSIINAELYLDCRKRQDNSIKLLKQLTNVKETK